MKRKGERSVHAEEKFKQKGLLHANGFVFFFFWSSAEIFVYFKSPVRFDTSSANLISLSNRFLGSEYSSNFFQDVPLMVLNEEESIFFRSPTEDQFPI